MPIQPVSGEIKAQPLNDNFSYLDSKASSMIGGPKETFTSESALKTKYPSGDSHVMLVTDSNGANGYLYSWDGSNWIKGPLYQAQGIADLSATTKKRTELGEMGVVFGASPALVDLPSKKIYFSQDSIHRIYYRSDVYNIPKSIIDFGSSLSENGIDNGVRLIAVYFRTETNSIVLIARNSPQYISERDILLGYILRDLEGNDSTATLNGNFSYSGDKNKSYETCLIIGDTPINYNFTDRIMRIYPNTKIVFQGKISDLNNSSGFIDVPFGTDEFRFVFNPESKTVYQIANNEFIPTNHILISTVREQNKKITMTSDYTISGIYPYAKTPELKYVGDEPVILDVIHRKLIFPPANGKNGRLFIEGRYYTLTNTNSVVDISSSLGGLIKIWFNVLNQKLRCSAWNDTTVNTGDALLGVARMVPNYSFSFNGDFVIDDGVIKDQETSDLKMLSNTLEDSITSWWVHPLAKNYKDIRDKLYLSYTDGLGYSGVISIDNVTNQVVKKRLKRGKVDDHNAVAIEIMQDGKIITAYAGGHNEDNKIHIRISKRPESVEDFENEITIDVDGETTYAQIFFKNNKWFVFFRFNTISWSYISSPDGLSWSSPVKLITSNLQYYCKFQDIEGEENIKVAMYSNPNSTDTTIRCAVFNTDTLKLELVDGTELGTENISKDSIPVLIDVEEGKKNRLLDLAISEKNVTKIVYCEFVDGDAGLYKVYDNGTIFDIVASGQAFYLPSGYFNGAVFKDAENIILSRGESGIDLIEMYSYYENGWTKSKDIVSQNLAIRPITCSEKVIYQTGYFNSSDYTDFLTDFKITTG